MSEIGLSADDTAKLHGLSSFIHDNPETGLQEFKASAVQKKLLREWGWSVQENVAGLETAFRAEMPVGNGIGPKFAFFTEFDALKDIGHACGHNLITVCGMAAAKLTFLHLKDSGVNGTVILFGCPAEEVLGGKITMCAHHVFNGIDAALAAHPFDVSSMDDGIYGVTRMNIKFHGRASHAGMAPQLGINALDAMILFFNGIALWRQQMPEASRIHGIILKGGSLPNVIPDETEAFFYLRGPDVATMNRMETRFREIASGAAVQTGCTFDCDRISAYQPERINQVLNRAFADEFETQGETVRHANGTEGRISSDFGDVSQLIPGAHVHFGICPPEQKGTPLHSIAFREAAKTDFAFGQAMKCASAMASVAIRFFTNADFRDAVRNDFLR